MKPDPQCSYSRFSPRETRDALRPGLRNTYLMKDINEKASLRRRNRATPRPIVDLRVERGEARSFRARAPRPISPLRTMTTDPASLLPHGERSATSLAGTPCGLGNPGDREHLKAWGRPMFATEEESISATWGRSRTEEASNNALKVWTWGRTTNARFSTWNSAGDVPNQPFD
jgi:hypothetical protein